MGNLASLNNGNDRYVEEIWSMIGPNGRFDDDDDDYEFEFLQTEQDYVELASDVGVEDYGRVTVAVTEAQRELASVMIMRDMVQHAPALIDSVDSVIESEDHGGVDMVLYRRFLTKPMPREAAKQLYLQSTRNTERLNDSTTNTKKEQTRGLVEACNAVQVIHSKHLRRFKKMPRYDEVTDICPTLLQVHLALPLAKHLKQLKDLLALSDLHSRSRYEGLWTDGVAKFERDYPKLDLFFDVHFVSHKWWTADHADEEGRDHARLLELLDDDDRGVYIIYDYTSFPQKIGDQPRPPVLKTKFDYVLRHSSNWVHDMITLDSPDYMNRGWCFFEYLVGSVTNDISIDTVKDSRFGELMKWTSALVLPIPSSLYDQGQAPGMENYRAYKIVTCARQLLRMFDSTNFTNGRDDSDIVEIQFIEFMQTQMGPLRIPLDEEGSHHQYYSVKFEEMRNMLRCDQDGVDAFFNTLPVIAFEPALKDQRSHAEFRRLSTSWLQAFGQLEYQATTNQHNVFNQIKRNCKRYWMMAKTFPTEELRVMLKRQFALSVVGRALRNSANQTCSKCGLPPCELDCQYRMKVMKFCMAQLDEELVQIADMLQSAT